MNAPRLVEPGLEWREAFLSMARAYSAWGNDRYAAALTDFDGYLRALALKRQGDASRPESVPGLELWLEHAGVLVGGLRLRLWLNVELEHEGGHIGYDVCPSHRRRGYGTAALRLGLARARELGITRVLVTTDSDNLASIKIIERNGGVLSGEVTSRQRGKLIRQYWIDAASRRVVVIFPQIESGSAWSQVLSLRDRFDPLARKVPAHLTLVPPFTDSISDSALEGHLQSVAKAVSVFPVKLQRVTLHEGEYLFLNVERGGGELVNLRDKLYQGILAPHRNRDNTFVPHMTIGRLLPDQVKDALDASNALTSQIEGRAESISAYRIDADGSRPLLFTIALQ